MVTHDNRGLNLNLVAMSLPTTWRLRTFGAQRLTSLDTHRQAPASDTFPVQYHQVNLCVHPRYGLTPRTSHPVSKYSRVTAHIPLAWRVTFGHLSAR
jgi:hypothetical protein